MVTMTTAIQCDILMINGNVYKYLHSHQVFIFFFILSLLFSQELVVKRVSSDASFNLAAAHL